MEMLKKSKLERVEEAEPAKEDNSDELAKQVLVGVVGVIAVGVLAHIAIRENKRMSEPKLSLREKWEITRKSFESVFAPFFRKLKDKLKSKRQKRIEEYGYDPEDLV